MTASPVTAKPDLLVELALLRETVSDAARLVRTALTGPVRAWQKEDGSGTLTDVDLAVDGFLRTRLLQARPNYGWISEESPDDESRLDCRRVFIVDPVDGTGNLAAGRPDFAISVALIEDGVPIAGVIDAPGRGEVFTAIRGGGATGNGKRLQGPATRQADGARLLGRHSVLQPRYWRDAPPRFERQGSLPMSLRACEVAQGGADVTLSVWPPWEWDIAAGDLVASEAGLCVSDLRGRTLRYNTRERRQQGLLIARAELHAEIHSRIRAP